MKPTALALIVVALSIACVDFDALQESQGVVADSGPRDDAIAPDRDGADGNAETGGDAAIGNVGFCASRTPGADTLCADWDENDAVDFGWDGKRITGTGALARDLGMFQSAPAAFSARVDKGSTDNPIYAALQKRFAARPNHVVLSADLSRPSFGADPTYLGYTWVLGLYDATSGNPNDLVYSTSIELDKTGFSVLSLYRKANGTTGQFSAPLTPSNASWTRFTIDVTLGASQHVIVKLDGATQVDQIIGDSVASSNPSVTAMVGIGAIGGGPLHVRYDNVTIDEL